MNQKIKSQKSYRADIASFEKDLTAPFFLYQAKEYNDLGLLIHETEYKPNGIKEMEVKYEYDERMHLKCKLTFYPLEDTTEKLEYAYNENGLKIKEENFFGDEVFEVFQYSYDDKGNITGQVRQDDEETEIERQESQFNDVGLIIKQSSYSNRELERVIDFEYNKGGLCTRETHAYPIKNEVETVEYEYNELGKRTLAITKDEAGEEIGYLEIEYDEKMNPTKYISETSGFHDSKSVNQMMYDDESRILENEFFDVLNNFLMNKESFVYGENGEIVQQEVFETNPMAGIKKTHYRLKNEYDYFGE